MAKFLALPNELIIKILSFFEPCRDRLTLLALCLTSKRLYSVAQLILYIEYVREIHCTCCHLHRDKPGRLIPLVYLARTLISRPDLAACLRRLDFDAYERHTGSSEVASANIDAGTVEVFASGVQNLPVARKSKLLLDAMALRSNPFLLFIASKAVNLEHLQLVVGKEGLRNLGPLFKAHPERDPSTPYLKNLKVLSIIDTRGKDNMNMRNLIHVLSLPRLEDVSIMGLNGNVLDGPTFDVHLQSMNVSSLTLDRACLNSTQLAKLMAGFKCLKYLSFDAGCFDENNWEAGQLQAPELVSALTSQTEHLTSLRVKFNQPPPSVRLWHDHRKFSSFGCLRNIVMLEIEQAPLRTTTELPSSVEVLTIRDCEYPVYGLLRSLSERSADCLKSLELVYLEPKASSPNAMLRIAPRFSPRNIPLDPACRSQFGNAYRRLTNIVKEAVFELQIMHETWAMHQRGEL